MQVPPPAHRSGGFTLIELLLVIAIVAVIAVTVLLTLSPTELLKQSRDSRRLSELVSLNKALALYQTDFPATSIGSSSVVYLSLPDTSSTCASWSLPSLPSGWTYSCKASSTYQNIDGTGWIPVNFSQFQAGAPFSALPTDARNTATYYYAYIVDASNRYALSSALESAKYVAADAALDGGIDPSRMEMGTNLQASAPLAGLVGYWTFDEGSGSTVSDSSGNGYNGSWGGSGGHWGAGKVGSNSGTFNGSNDQVSVPGYAALNITTGTVMAWVKYNSGAAFPLLTWTSSGNYGPSIFNYANSYNAAVVNLASTVGAIARSFNVTTPVNVQDGGWHHVAFVITGDTSGSVSGWTAYMDGTALAVTGTYTGGSATSKSAVKIGNAYSYFANGSIDDVRIYSRALSATEIQAVYNATH